MYKYNPNAIPQTQRAKPNQVVNNAGGYVFPTGDMVGVERFLVLGSASPTYYASVRKLTADNAEGVIRVAQSDPESLVRKIVEFSDSGRIPNNSTAIFALALASKTADPSARKLFYGAMPLIARTGTHLFEWSQYIEDFGGWSRGARNAVQSWYDMNTSKLAYQLVKYRQRNGWTHRDVLRLAHVKANSELKNQMFAWATGKEIDIDIFANTDAKLIFAYELAKTAKTEKEIVFLITKYGLPFEAIDSAWLASPKVWEVLVEQLPLDATIRNLGRMTSNGSLAPLSNVSKRVVEKLSSADYIKKSRMHPISLLKAFNQYGRGRGEKGSLSWNPVQSVVEALEEAFYLSFGAIEKTDENVMYALDVSGSMGSGEVAGLNMTPREASAVMAMVNLRQSKNSYTVGFSNTLVDVPINSKMSLSEVIEKIKRIPMGGTDCALPMLHAASAKMDVDKFVTYTDNETWAGNTQPFQALQKYRKVSGRNAKMIVVGLTATNFSIADPDDAGSLDIVGFDTSAPNVIAKF